MFRPLFLNHIAGLDYSRDYKHVGTIYTYYMEMLHHLSAK